MKEVDNIQEKEVEYDISFIPKEDLDENLYKTEEDNGIDLNNADKNSDISVDLEQEINKAADLLHEERTSFYSDLTDKMDEAKYAIFNKCRTTNFLSRGKEAFQEWIGIH